MSTIQRADVLRGLTAEEVADIVALGTIIEVPSGTALFHLGAPADRVFIVERGGIALTLPMQVYDETEDVLIEERTAGQLVGWSALIPPHRFTLTGKASIDSEVLAIPRTALLHYLSAHPAIGYVVTRNAAELIGDRLQVFQAMWLRELQRAVLARAAAGRSQQ